MIRIIRFFITKLYAIQIGDWLFLWQLIDKYVLKNWQHSRYTVYTCQYIYKLLLDTVAPVARAFEIRACITYCIFMCVCVCVYVSLKLFYIIVSDMKRKAFGLFGFNCTEYKCVYIYNIYAHMCIWYTLVL